MGDFKDWVRNQRATATTAILTSFVLAVVYVGFTHPTGLISLRITNFSFQTPWTFLTYPWEWNIFGSGMALLAGIFLLVWFYQIGSIIEREMGSLRFASFFGASILIASASLWTVAKSMGSPIAISGPYLPIAATSVAWAVRNRSAVIMLYGVIPLNGIFIGWSFGVLTLLMFGFQYPALGLAACIPLFLAFLFASDKIPGLPFVPNGVVIPLRRRIDPKKKEATTRGNVQYDQSYFDEVKRREQERLEKERLRKLLGED